MHVEHQPKSAVWAIVEDSGEYLVETGFPDEKAARRRMLDKYDLDHDCLDFDLDGNGHVKCLECVRQAREEEDGEMGSKEADEVQERWERDVNQQRADTERDEERYTDQLLAEMKDGDRPRRVR